MVSEDDHSRSYRHRLQKGRWNRKARKEGEEGNGNKGLLNSIQEHTIHIDALGKKQEGKKQPTSASAKRDAVGSP